MITIPCQLLLLDDESSLSSLPSLLLQQQHIATKQNGTSDQEYCRQQQQPLRQKHQPQRNVKRIGKKRAPTIVLLLILLLIRIVIRNWHHYSNYKLNSTAMNTNPIRLLVASFCYNNNFNIDKFLSIGYVSAFSNSVILPSFVEMRRKMPTTTTRITRRIGIATISSSSSYRFFTNPSSYHTYHRPSYQLSLVQLHQRKQQRMNDDDDDIDNKARDNRKKGKTIKSVGGNLVSKMMFWNKNNDSPPEKIATDKKIKEATKSIKNSNDNSENSNPLDGIISMIPFVGNKNDTTTVTKKDEKRMNKQNSNSSNPLTSSIQNIMENVSKLNNIVNIPNITTSIQQTFNSLSLLLSNNDTNSNRNKKANSKNEEWVAVMPKTRISPGEMVPVTIAGGIDLLVIASNDGRTLYCIANSCPHLGTPLETGKLTRLPKVPTTATTTKSSTATTSATSSSVSSTSRSKDDSKNDDTNYSNNTISSFDKMVSSNNLLFTEMQLTDLLQQDGCEDCIVCPLHQTAFALRSGEVRGEWCPYPPVLGKIVGSIKPPTSAAVFDIRTRGKNIEVRLNTPLV